jgi:hypothetical protein
MSLFKNMRKAKEPCTFVAVIEKHDRTEKRFVKVPLNQSLELDEESATRKWLWPYLKSEYHLVEFLEIKNSR